MFSTQWCRNRGGQGGHWPPQYLADQLTLFRPWGADSAHPLLVAPPIFFTFRHHWYSQLLNSKTKSGTSSHYHQNNVEKNQNTCLYVFAVFAKHECNPILYKLFSSYLVLFTPFTLHFQFSLSAILKRIYAIGNGSRKMLTQNMHGFETLQRHSRVLVSKDLQVQYIHQDSKLLAFLGTFESFLAGL